MDYDERARKEWAELARVIGVTPEELRELLGEAIGGLRRWNTDIGAEKLAPDDPACNMPE